MAVLHLDLGKLRRNLAKIRDLCETQGRKFLPVTKLIGSDPVLLEALDLPWLTQVADTSPLRLGGLNPARFPGRVLLRPLFSEIDLIARNAGRVFLSSLEMARRLSARPRPASAGPLEITVMAEGGDLRDGVPLTELEGFLTGLRELPGLRLAGLGVNYGCLAGQLPSRENLQGLTRVYRTLEDRLGAGLGGISLGGTVCWDPFSRGLLPPEVTEIRMGEACFFAWNTTGAHPIPGLEPRVFALELEVMEVWNKGPLEAYGQAGPYGLNAFGETLAPPDPQARCRLVLEGGENFAPARALTSSRPGLVPVGETHEYLVAELQGEEPRPKPGDRVIFWPGYEAVARCYEQSELLWKEGAL